MQLSNVAAHGLRQTGADETVSGTKDFISGGGRTTYGNRLKSFLLSE